MNRRSIIRFQLIVLGMLVLLLAGRALWPGAGRTEAIAIGDPQPYHLRHIAFAAPDGARAEIVAAGSLEHEEPGAPLAATAWIVRRDDGKVVWRLQPGESTTRRGTLLRTTEQISLEPGVYDGYFAAFGNDMNRRGRGGFLGRIFGGRPWENDADRWELTVRSLAEQPPLVRVNSAPDRFGDQGIVWRAAPIGNRHGERKVFEVTAPMDVRVYSIGELSRTGRDYGWIDDLTRRTRIWELSEANSAPAGGHASNRIFDAPIHLEAGVYAAGYETDGAHAHGSWRANPPYDPAGWGITLATTPDNLRLVHGFDPRQSRSPLLELTRAGTNEHDRVEFELDAPMDVVIEALGEISSSQQYDYGWIETVDGQKVWEMRHANSVYAGGHDYNRSALEIVRLEPGQYAAHFKTDESHAFGDWQKSKPHHPDQWGMALFPLDREVPEGAVRVLTHVRNTPVPPEPPMGGHPHMPHFPDLRKLRELRDLRSLASLEDLQRFMRVNMSNVGNDAHLQENLSIDSARKIIVVAQGEITPDAEYDEAWIERADNGESVWSMNWENTLPAGGDERNRLFAGPVELPEGEYVVHYRSDASHAFGDFDEIAPEDPGAWGISIFVVP